MASSVDTVAFIYKRKYSDDKAGEQAKRDHLLQELVDIREGCGGEDFRYVVRTGNPQGISSTFADAQSGASVSKGVQFATEPSLKYAVVDLDGPSMARAEGNDNAFFDLVTLETDGQLEELGDSLAFDLYQSGNGIRGRRSSISGDVVTLTDAEDARNFKVGMTVGASANSDGSSPRSGTTTVAKIDEDAGTVELDDETQITSFANSDYLFRKGDPGNCMDGLGVLIPLTAASTIRGATVDTDVRRLQGVRISDTSPHPEENAGLLAVKIRQGGKRANCVIWNPLTFWEVVRRRDSKVEFQSAGGEAGYGFETIKISTPAGVLTAYSDPDCPNNRQYVGDKSVLQLRAIKKYVHIIRDDGRPSMRQTSSDGIEIRARNMSQPVITEPGRWGVAAV